MRFDKVEPDPPRRSDRLPEGLHGVGSFNVATTSIILMTSGWDGTWS